MQTTTVDTLTLLQMEAELKKLKSILGIGKQEQDALCTTVFNVYQTTQNGKVDGEMVLLNTFTTEKDATFFMTLNGDKPNLLIVETRLTKGTERII